MELHYNARKVDFFNFNTLFSLLICLIFLIAGVYMILYPENIKPSKGSIQAPPEIFGAIFIFFALLIPISFFSMLKTNYYITDDGIRITKPVAHTKIFRYSEIESIEKIDHTVAEKIVEDLEWKKQGLNMQARSENAISLDNLQETISYAKELSDLYAYNNGTINVSTKGGRVSRTSVRFGPLSKTERTYIPPDSISVSAKGDFVLLKIKDSEGKTRKFLLTPENLDDFVQRVRVNLGK